MSEPIRRDGEATVTRALRCTVCDLRLSPEAAVHPTAVDTTHPYCAARALTRGPGVCVRCGRPAANRHHRLPRSRGGTDDPHNVVPLCGSGSTGCHGWVHANPAEAERVGLTVDGQIVRGVYQGSDPEYRRRYPEET